LTNSKYYDIIKILKLYKSVWYEMFKLRLIKGINEELGEKAEKVYFWTNEDDERYCLKPEEEKQKFY